MFTIKEGVLLLEDGAVENFSKSKDSLHFEYSAGYEAPQINMSFLRSLSELFGTDDIDIDGDIHERGCETCDYGSRYGHTIYVNNITKNMI